MVLCCSCLESCCPPSVRQPVYPDVSELSSNYTVPSVPSDNDIAFFNAPNGIRAALEVFEEAADLRGNTIILLRVRKAFNPGFKLFKFLLKCQIVETGEIVHVCAGYLVESALPAAVYYVLRNLKVNDLLQSRHV